MGILAGKELAYLLLDGWLKIAPIGIEQIRPASVALRLGAELEIPEWGRTVDPGPSGDARHPAGRTVSLDGGPHELLSGQCVSGATLERLDIPDCCAGRICVENGLGLLGLEIRGADSLEPGFSGRVPLFIRNAGLCSIMLHGGMPVCRREISVLEDPAAPWRRRSMSEDCRREIAGFLEREFCDRKPHGALSRYLEESIRNLAKDGA